MPPPDDSVLVLRRALLPARVPAAVRPVAVLLAMPLPLLTIPDLLLSVILLGMSILC
jgi:hypothetical protein